MFCPRCGSAQVSGNMRYCSRCGFALAGVLALLEAGDEMTSPDATVQRSLYRRIVSLMGAKVMFASVVLTPVAFLLALGVDSPGPLLGPLLLFLLGFAHVAYALLFGTNLVAAKRNFYEGFDAPRIRHDLPSARESFVPAAGFERVDTARMTPQPSVTEATTNLLRREGEPES